MDVYKTMLMWHLDGKPAAEIRIVSKMPHARSCCTALTESKLHVEKKKHINESDFHL